MNQKWKIWGIIMTVLILPVLAFGKGFSSAVAPITLVNGQYLLRGQDAGGSGHYGAPRGTRLHAGLDIKCIPGEAVYSPYSGFVTRIVDPYGDGEYSGLEIKVENIDSNVKIMYMSPFPGLVGKTVSAGQLIGECQNISERYGPSVTPHLHVEIWKSGSYTIDPYPLLFR